MKNILLVLNLAVLFFGIGSGVCAQDSQTQYLDSLNSYKNALREGGEKVKQLDDSILELRGGPEVLAKLRRNIDSLRDVKQGLEEQIVKLSGNNESNADKNKTMGEYNLFIEECICRFANGRLDLKYDEADVNKAIRYMDSVKDEGLRKRFAEVPGLLNRYAQDYKDFMDVIQEAQKDFDRTDPLSGKEYRQKYINRLKNLPYYKKYYLPAQNKWDSWRIYYLSDEIDKAIKILEKHNFDTQPPYMVDFSYLLLD